MSERALRVGIVGPNRTVNGTGPFVARSLAELGARVVAAAARTAHGADAGCARLRAAYGIVAEPMPSVSALLDRDDLDAVAICSPADVHEEHLRAAIARGLHIFCEKPLVWGGAATLAETTGELTALCTAKNLVLHESTQWVYTLATFERAYGPIRRSAVETLDVELSPPDTAPELMLREAFPHVASLVIALGGGASRRIVPCWDGTGVLETTFESAGGGGRWMRVRFRLTCTPSQPRPAAYAVNGRWLRRHIGPDYGIGFEASGRRYDCPDPLTQSVDAFLTSVQGVRAGGQAPDVTATVAAASLADDMLAALRRALGSGRSAC